MTEGSQLEIKPFAPAQADQVPGLILPIQRDEFGINITLQNQPDLLDIPGFYQKGAGNFWLALLGGQVIGSISLLDIGNRQAALRKMFVAQPFRGAPPHPAAALLQELFSWSRAQGLAEIFLGATDKFKAAHRFYEKNGFREITKPELPPAFPVMSVDSKFYQYTL